MPAITILPTGQTIEAPAGANLLQALLAAHADIAHKCDGKAECGSCHVFIHDGRKGVSRIQRAENERLDQLVGVGSKSRLACQVTLGEDNATIELLGFASGG